MTMTDTIAEIKEALERPAYIHEGTARRWLRFLLDENTRLTAEVERLRAIIINAADSADAIFAGIEVAQVLCDAVPSRAHLRDEDDPLQLLGLIVNTDYTGHGKGYNVVKVARALTPYLLAIKAIGEEE